jgi:hypothetical protein
MGFGKKLQRRAFYVSLCKKASRSPKSGGDSAASSSGGSGEWGSAFRECASARDGERLTPSQLFTNESN